MKTICTDKYGLYPWFFGIGGVWEISHVYGYVADRRYVMATFAMIGSAAFIYLAGKRVWDMRTARREGRDPAIIRITADAK